MADYNLAENNVNRTITKVENALMQSGRFSLPKRRCGEVSTDEDVVVLDVTECAIERPKKSSRDTIAARRNGTV